jgi:dynein heavy chain
MAEVHQRIIRDREAAIDIFKSTTDLERVKVLANIIISTDYIQLIHHQLTQADVTNPQDFLWQSQLRYYWEDENLLLRMIETSLMYGYEYLGGYERLVMTGLTLKCYRVLTLALHQIKGGSVEGPTGTGKSETVKDLAKACGKQCIVFNCSEGLDYRPLGKFIKGLACSGAWSCFDEFHRVKGSVLSIVSQDILMLQRGIQAKLASIVLDDTEIILNPTCAIYITMESVSALPLKIPDNFRVLFRSIAMMNPDATVITQVCLSAKGFTTAHNLARKVTSMFNICQNTLSKQPHYEFGLRSIKSVIDLSIQFKHENREAEEMEIIFNAFHRLKFSELLPEDQKIFMEIAADIFPRTEVSRPAYEAINEAIAAVCENLLLDCNEYFRSKVQQLYEMIRHNWGTFSNLLTTSQIAFTFHNPNRSKFENIETSFFKYP